MCVACSKKNPVGNVPKSSRKPIVSLDWQSRFELDLMVFVNGEKGSHLVCSYVGFLLSRSCHILGVSMRAAKEESKPHRLQAAGDIWHHWISNDISHQ